MARKRELDPTSKLRRYASGTVALYTVLALFVIVMGLLMYTASTMPITPHCG